MAYDHLLVTTDGSEASWAAVEHGLDLAREVGAEITALHVVDDRASGRGMVGSSLMDRSREAGKEAAQEVVEAAEERGIPVESVVLEGVPSEEIVDYAANNGMDLIVMGTHGRTGIRAALIGSVAERVVRHSTVPVLTVRRES